MLFARAKAFLTPRPKTTPDEWGAENRVYPPTTGWPGPRNPGLTPYVIPFERAKAAGGYRRYVAVMGAQMGKTEAILDMIGARLDQRPAPIIYVGPTREFLVDQFEPRVMGLLDEARCLRDRVARGKRMKKTVKYVNGVPLRLAHAGSPTPLKSSAAVEAYVDEYDDMRANVRGQGDPLGLIEARGFTYADFSTVIVSTPSVGNIETEIDKVSGLEFWKFNDPEEIESPIWRLFQEGTRFHYAWPCPRCGEFFIPRLRLLRWPKKATPAQARRATVMSCPHCDAEFDEGSDGATKEAMNNSAVFVAPGQNIVDGVVVGDPPDTQTWSMWVSGLASPFVSWGARVEAYLTAIGSGEVDKIQTQRNAQFGELHAASSGEAPEWLEVFERRAPYALGTVPPEVIRIVMGVDVQKHSLIYVIRGFGGRGTSYLIDFGQIYGSTDHHEVWDELAEIFTQPIDGMMIERVMIDSGFRPDKRDAGDYHRVYEFCRRYQWIAFPTKGKAVMRTPFAISSLEHKPDGKKRPMTIKLVHVNTDFFKSLVHSRLRTPQNSAGAFFVPDGITEDYAKQLTSEVRSVVGGKPKWTQIRRDNHFFDCECLCAVAGQMANVDRIPEGARRDEDHDHHVDAVKPTRKPGTIPQSEFDQDAPPENSFPETPRVDALRSVRDRFSKQSGVFNDRGRR